MSRRLKEFYLTLSVLFLTGITAKAEVDGTTLGKNLLRESADGIKSLGEDVVLLLQYIIGLVGLIFLVLAISKFIKGEREAGESLAKWFGGITLGFLLLTVLKKSVFG